MEEKKDKENAGPTEEAKAHKDEAGQSESPQSIGGGGWGFSPFSVLSNLQKAAQEISRNAAVAAEKAAKSIADMQIAEDSEPSTGEAVQAEIDTIKEAKEDDDDKLQKFALDKSEKASEYSLRKSALDKLEKASEDSFFGQGLKVLDHSVENLTSGAWQALGSAWKGSSNFVQKLESSAVNLAESIQHGGVPGAAGSVSPSLLETGRAFTAKGMQVLEYVGKETMDLLITETGIEVEKDSKGFQQDGDEDQLLEEVTFDRCFYIYGGPEQLEELEALSNHYALLYNRRKAKLPSEKKSLYEGNLKLIQQIFNLALEMEGNGQELDKGKKIETRTVNDSNEMKGLHDSGVNKAAEMAAGFTNALTGLTANDILQRTASRLETLHSEGVHRLSEMCCYAVSYFLMLGKSVIANAGKVDEEVFDTDIVNIEWPEDSVEKAKLIRIKAQLMVGYVDSVFNSFLTGISDVAEAYAAAIKDAVTAGESHENVAQTSSIQEKANTFAELLRSDYTRATSKIQDGVQFLANVVISTSVPAA